MIIKNHKSESMISFFLIVIAIIGRFIPHPWNVTPITAIALFSGFKFRSRLGAIVPILALIISDSIIGFYNIWIMSSVYVSFILMFIIARSINKHSGPFVIIGTSILSTTIFFIITNWSVWAFGDFYQRDIYGLLESFIAGVPFYKNMLVGDLFYVLVLFVSYELVIRLFNYIYGYKTLEAKV